MRLPWRYRYELLTILNQVILGLSITAYLTLVLLAVHYLTVHNVRRKNLVNVVDDGLLTFFRHQMISWKPSRRFEYAMEKSVLILSDTQLVTGLGILIAGYSQLKCGISAYHWQIMVFVAWFASFSFLSAMTFLEGYFQTNNNMRLIRVGFMIVLASLLVAALLPTGSRNWLDLFHEAQGEAYYPSLSTLCFYKQLTMGNFTTTWDPKIWSMVFSVFVVVTSYLRCGIRLFDPGAGTSHTYLRAWPGSKVKQGLHFLERKAMCEAIRKSLAAKLWYVPYVTSYALFTCCRAFYDISGSMLLEIISLAFAMAWGTIKVWSTRSAAGFSFDGSRFTRNQDVLEENSWSFGQTLPLILILLPLLSMAQAYLDDDARAQETFEQALDQQGHLLQEKYDSGCVTESSTGLPRHKDHLPDPRKSTSWSIARCDHHSPQHATHNHLDKYSRNPDDDVLPLPSPRSLSNLKHFRLPNYPYANFTHYPWYNDQILLLLCQTLQLVGFSLFVLAELANILGISAILRNRLFLLWVFAMIPLASLVHLAAWYVAASAVVHWRGCEKWLKGTGRDVDRNSRWWRRVTLGQSVYWGLRMGLVLGCVMFTLFMSLEVAGPDPLADSL
jgi:hypothetical protein